MLPRDRIIEILKPHLWRLPLVLCVLLLAGIGCYAFSLERNHIGLVSVSVDGGKCLAHDGDQYFVIDTQGGLINQFELRAGYRSRPRWTANGDLFFINSTVAPAVLERLKLGPHGSVSREVLPAESPMCCYWSRSGYIVHVEYMRDESRYFLRFFQDGVRELSRIEIDNPDRTHVSVTPRVNGDVGVVVRTGDERPKYLVVDPETGQVQRSYQIGENENGFAVINNEQYVTRYSEDGLNVVAFDAPHQPIISILWSAPVMVDKHRMVVTKIGDGVKALHLYDLRTPGISRAIASIPFSSRIRDLNLLEEIGMPEDFLPLDTESLLVADGRGEIRRVQLGSGDQQLLYSVRPWYWPTFHLAAWGLPTLGLLWLWLGYRKRLSLPVLESIVVIAICCVTCLLWYRVASSASGQYLHSICVTLFGTLTCLVLILSVNTRLLVGHGIPVAVIGLASVLRVFDFFHDGREFEHLSSAVILACGLALGLLTVRRVRGRLLVSDAMRAGPFAQVSIVQFLMLTGALATYLAVTQELQIRFEHAVEVPIVCYGIYLALAAFFSYFLAVCVDNRIAALILFVFVIGFLFLGFDWISSFPSVQLKSLGPTCWQYVFQFRVARELIWHPMVHVVYVAVLVFCLMRYCRCCGWTFADRLPVSDESAESVIK